MNKQNFGYRIKYVKHLNILTAKYLTRKHNKIIYCRCVEENHGFIDVNISTVN